jgi:hypothetical protein
MFEKFEAIGIWWLPENPEKKLHGTLSYDPETGTILQVMGSFETSGKISDFRDYDIINGFAGSEITLYKCFTKSAPIFSLSPDTISTEYFANFIFKGHIFEKTSDIKFRDARISYNNFGSWFFRHTVSFLPSKNGDFTLTTKALESITADINENLKISLISGNERSSKWVADGCSLLLIEKSFVDIETTTDIDFEQFMEVSSKLQQFLTLAINKPIWIQNLWISVPNAGEENSTVEVFLEIQKHLLGNGKLIHPTEMPFSFDTISNKFERLLQNWFEKSPFLRPIFNLYFALQYSDKMYVEHRFLNLISCLESYHRRRFDGKYLSDKNYNEFKELIIKSFPKVSDDNYDDFKTKFIGSLEYGNELGLRKRLKLICSENNAILSKYIKNQAQFIDKVVVTRNYRTHFDKRLEDVAISDISEYLDFNLKLKMLVELCIFKELEFNMDEIEAIFARNREYQHMLSQTSK